MAFLAKPKIQNKIDSKIFPTAKEARKYLEEYTGYQMKIEDWMMVEKLIEVEDIK